MTEPEHDAYIKLIHKLDAAAQERIGPFKKPNPNKELLEDAYDAIVAYMGYIGQLETELKKERQYLGYPLEDLALFAHMCHQQHIEMRELRRFVNTADMAARAGFDYALYRAKDEIARFTQRLECTTLRNQEDIPRIPKLIQEPTEADIEEVTK